MKIYWVSYASHNYAGVFTNQEKLAEQATKVGMLDGVFKYRTPDIQDFIDKADKLFSDVKMVYPRLKHSRYFAWKPYVILKSLEKINENDVVVYHDAGRSCYKYKIDRDIRPLCKYAVDNHRGIFANFGPFWHKRLCKRDCFKVMGCDSEFYWKSRQANGSFGVYQKNDFTLEFVREWLRYCMHESMIVTDSPSKVPEFPEFEAHRHDQSILTNMLLKYNQHRGLPLDPKHGNKYKRPYGWEKSLCGSIAKFESWGLL